MANRVQVFPISGDFELGNNIETSNNTTPVALAVTLANAAKNSPDWLYSAAAEDRGIAGVLDGQPGIIYSGPAGTTGYLRTHFHNVDVEYADEGLADPDNEDTVSLDIFVNSVSVLTSAEGQTALANEAAEVEFNVEAGTLALVEGDVVRFALVPVVANEASIDWDVEEGGEWSLS